MADYKDTLNLPQTKFEMRAGLAKKEPRILERWDAEDLYGRIRAARKGRPRYVLHDGPPYANGHLHHGHILNKILKDIVVKDRNMRGLDAGFIPGWDCHGLPIEVQVDKKLGKKKRDMSKAEVRRACREYADKFIGIQREEFKRLGVLGRWREPYRTMSYGYEAAIIRELAKFAGSNLLYKGLRPVNWCSTHRTALAEAEVEYEDHVSPSIYVAFRLQEKPPELAGQEVDLVIWTTTPWTLPANRAVCLHPAFDYVAYPVRDRLCIVARGLLGSFLEAIGEPDVDAGRIAGQWKGGDLTASTYHHPLRDEICPVILGDHVTMEAGTGCVHTAPGHGADDFAMGRQYGLELLSPVDERGRFTAEGGAFAGRHVFEANGDIVQTLAEQGTLLNQPGETITHRYAHCWRCHKPIILRATEQWFVAIDEPFKGGGRLRRRALQSLNHVNWIPAWGEDRIRGMLEARPDWCLSRQRTWGVPIAVVYCTQCQTPMVSEERMNRVADVFAREGADAWYIRSVAELMGDDLRCEKCGHHEFRKEEDILDVWFDSGVSFAAVIERLGEGQSSGPLVDLYLEGSDQHRGWFHSALLCGLVTREKPPYRAVLTHGFIVDENGHKYSKSAGNYVDPFKAINKNGAELLRLWVASSDYREDIRISDEILARLSDSYRKVRNTVRYLLGNLYDFEPDRHLLPAGDLLRLDRYGLALTQRAGQRMLEAYERFDFHLVLNRLVDLCTVDISAFYVDVLKDRLYASRADSRERRSAQTALYGIARDLLRLMAPVFSFTAEEAWEHLPRLNGDPDSVHLALMPGIDERERMAALRTAVAAEEETLVELYQRPREVRREINVVLEDARKDKQIGSSVEAMVRVGLPAADLEKLNALGPAALADLFIVSRVELEEAEELTISVDKAPGTKCARCWLYREDVGHDAKHPTVCGRCAEAL